MSATDFVDFTHASCPIHADASTTWRVLTTETGALFMGAEFDTDWIVGHPITFEGNWKGTAYRDHGAIVSFDPERLIQFTQFSSMSGKADEAENYDLVSFELSGADTGTLATLRLGKPAGVTPPSGEELAALTANLDEILAALKDHAERG